MRRRAFIPIHLLVITALIFGSGAQWFMLQSFAWSRMFLSYSQSASIGEALEKTFDGEHPCALCEHIRSAKKETQHDKAPQPELSPLVGVLVPGIVAWEPPAVPFAYYPGFESRALARPFVPPTPPPRLA